MNQALAPTSFTLARASQRAPWSAWTRHEENARLRRLRSLLALFALYAAALLIVVTLSEGADIGCVLGGIAGHVLYATHRVVRCWRDAASLEDAKARAAPVLRPRLV
jgi:hypothetical protein